MGFRWTPSVDYQVTYRTDIQSAEMNLRMPVVTRLYGVMGIRYLEVEEQFDIVDSAASTADVIQRLLLSH
jgi:hypothetical protein